MLRELLSIFRAEQPLSAMGENFAKMLRLNETQYWSHHDPYYH